MTGAVSRIRQRAARLGRRIGRQPALEDLQPPGVLVDAVTGGNFDAGGREFVEHLIRFGGLRPSDRVLDVGCGIGRIARPLAPYLEGGSYEGFDVHQQAIRWCEDNITARAPQFRFKAVSVRSGWFNPWGKVAAEDLTFPYDDDEFDFAFAVSLFTHLLAPATERYLAEIGRVLKPGGRWLLTFFLIPDEGHPEPSPEWQRPPDWPGGMRFGHEMNGCLLMDPQHPDRAVAHEEAWLMPAIARAGLTVRAVHRGYWPGRHGLSFQDLMLGDAGNA